MIVHALFLPIHSVRRHIARRRQIRTALHMLSASGVLRPSHVELRYTAPLTRKRLGEGLSVRSLQPASHHAVAVSRWPSQPKLIIGRMRSWVGNVRPAHLQTGESATS